jgi:hypothetical protein
MKILARSAISNKFVLRGIAASLLIVTGILVFVSVTSGKPGAASSVSQPNISVLNGAASPSDSLPPGAFKQFIARNGQPTEVRLAASNLNDTATDVYVATTEAGNVCLLVLSPIGNINSGDTVCGTPSIVAANHILYLATATQYQANPQSQFELVGLVTDDVQNVEFAGSTVPINQSVFGIPLPQQGASSQTLTLNLTDGTSVTVSVFPSS